MRQVLSPNEIKRKLPSTKNVLGTCSVFPLHSSKAIIKNKLKIVPCHRDLHITRDQKDLLRLWKVN